MKEFIINACSAEDTVLQMQAKIGGEISQRFGLYTLDIDNDIAKGCIRFITFDWGINLIEYNLIYFEDVLFITNISKYNPLYFIYCSSGYLSHQFEYEKKFQIINEYHSSILATKEEVNHQVLFPKGVHLIINIIGVERKEFLKKRLNNVSELNSNLHKVFVDKNHEKEYYYYGPIDLKMEDHVKRLRNISNKTISDALKIEGSLYQLLSMHITKHDKFQKGEIIPESLLKKELMIIRRFSKKIIDDPSINYSLDQLSKDTGLSQAKLQEGFKFLYGRTVTEYIRHVRLETARDLMETSDLNISQIVYSIGFTSRSYFSKIFKQKYEMTPMEFKKQMFSTVKISV